MAGQYRFKDINGNIVAQISSSADGTISFSGSAVDFSNASTITLGQVQLAGTASNALLLDGFDSTAFVFTSSFNTISQSISSQLNTLQTTSGSNIGRLNNLESKSSSVDISISNINSVTASFSPRVSNLETKSASVDISISNINSFTASNANQSLNSKTGSYATTGSNTFFGTQTFSGSVYIANDLVVQGSSSIQYISASSVNIGTNIVRLNTANPSVRFAGLTIIDSGSVGGSGSFLYDSVHDEFVFVHRGNGTNITSSHFVLGPETYDSLGNEIYLSCNTLSKGTGKEHLVDSCIFDNGTTICVNANLKGSGQVCSLMGNFSCIGIGTTTPPTKFAVKDGTDTVLQYYATCSDGYLGMGNDVGSIGGASKSFNLLTGTQFTFSTAATEKLRITSCGNVGINTITPLSRFDVALQGCESFTIGNCSNTITCGDLIGALTFVSRDGSTNSTGGIAGIRSYATQTYNTGGVEGDLRFYVSRVNTQPNGTILAGQEVLKLSQDGVACFTCQICTPHLIGLNNVSIGSSCTSSDGYNTRLRITNIPNDTFVFSFNNQACRAIMYMYGGNTNNPQGYTAWADNTSGNTNHLISHNTGQATYFAIQGGCVGIGTNSPATKLTVYTGSGFISGTNDGIRLQVAGYCDTARNTIVWHQDASNLILARYGIEWNSSLGQMNFVWRDMYNNGTGTTEQMRLQANGNIGFGESNPGTEKMVILGGSGHNNVFLRLKTDGTHGTKPQIHFDSGLVGINRPTKAMIMGGYNSPTGGGGGVMQFYTNDTSENLQQRMCIDPAGQVTIMGALAKGSGSFRICHPLPAKANTHALVHSFIEGPNADLIYSGHTKLTNGIACINIDCSARMTQGTFEALNRCVRIFTTNETSWDAVRGKVCGNMVVIESQNNTSEDEISWMVIGERQDQHMFDTEWTDSEGKVITEPEIVIVNDDDII